MKRSPCVIFADPDGWRVVYPNPGAAPARDVDDAAATAVIAPRDAAPAALATALRAAGYTGRPVVLALPSDACLCAPIATGDLPARHRGAAMLYRLEECLPVSAEDVVADFIPAGPDGALGVCVQRRPFHALLDTLRAAGVTRVAAACPRSLLALQHFLDTRAGAEDPGFEAELPEMILWADGPSVEAFVLGTDRALHAWSVVPNNLEDVALHLGMQSLGGGGSVRPQRVTACGVSPEVLERLRAVFPGKVVAAPPVAARELATDAARAVVARRLAPWVDFAQADAAGGSASRRAFAQARGPLTWLAASAAVLALSATVALFWRAARYDRLAADYDARQHDLFRRTLPGQPVPPDVRSRLASEEQRLRTAAPGSGVAAAGGRTSAADAMLVLRDVIVALPADVRFTVSELKLDGAGARFTLLGEARSHADAQAIADALRGGFEVEPPTTEFQPGKGAVLFTITGGLVKRAAPVAVSSAATSAGDAGGAR